MTSLFIQQDCYSLLTGYFCKCRVVSRENVQNVKSFRRTAQIPFIVALFFTICSELSFEQYLVIKKH